MVSHKNNLIKLSKELRQKERALKLMFRARNMLKKVIGVQNLIKFYIGIYVKTHDNKYFYYVVALKILKFSLIIEAHTLKDKAETLINRAISE